MFYFKYVILNKQHEVVTNIKEDIDSNINNTRNYISLYW